MSRLVYTYCMSRYLCTYLFIQLYLDVIYRRQTKKIWTYFLLCYGEWVSAGGCVIVYLFVYIS